MRRKKPAPPQQRQQQRKRKNIPPGVRRERRIKFMGAFLIFCVLGLIFRIWYIQDRHGDDFTTWAAREQARREMGRAQATFTPERGNIWDRNMQPITNSQQVFTLYMDVEALHIRNQAAGTGNAVRDEVFHAIIMQLGVPLWDLENLFALDDNTGELAIRAGRNSRAIAHNVPADVAIELTDTFRELHRREGSYRWHPDPFFAPQVIGFMRGDAITGLERRYREELAGEAGHNIWAQGGIESVPVRHGHTIITTFDSEIQRLAQQFVNDTFLEHPAQGVGMIVMDPNTSEILAMAQAPTFSLSDPFNPEYFTDPFLAEYWDELTEGQRAYYVNRRLWNNYHITGSNEPGSVFKPFVIAAAIEEGVIMGNTQFHCEGVRFIHEMRVPCHNEHGCGNLSLRRALYRSCNLAMATINHDMGRDTFYRYRGYFGFGERTGIDFPGEDAVSHPLVMYPRARLNDVEMATSSMGQGFNATTIQLINGYAALINGGILRQPFFVSQIIDANHNPVYTREPQDIRRVISQETSDFMRNEMRYVVSMQGNNGGTGRRSYIAGFDVAGKTGTAQQGVREDRIHNLSYISFFPASDPQFLILMTIDRIEDDQLFAGNTVVPITGDFIRELIRMRNIQPVGEVENPVAEYFGHPMPDFSGQRMTEAVRTAVNMNVVGYQTPGGGTVISHTWPPAGLPVPETAPIIFYLDPTSRVSERMATVPDVVGMTAAVAARVLEDANFTTVLTTERVAPPPSAEEEFTARTFGAELAGENLAPPPPLPYVVFQQFPAPGVEIEQGTQIIIRAR
ncbi:MAG: penicillin-binding transpeptidase domain-containing protein [Defluviitaleaceae bacterium]|nr:penicillin-binding transpeptidase domain-containing protein [Defluviitaleaceae bacterium]